MNQWLTPTCIYVKALLKLIELIEGLLLFTLLVAIWKISCVQPPGIQAVIDEIRVGSGGAF
ncbi:MAG: hypothetical protein CMIDDMOC_00223 [Sodalis sp. Fle]|nr:MAG: hypothetical protein CMIDDMOC_00223 [Sodalis sp. Fle]